MCYLEKERGIEYGKNEQALKASAISEYCANSKGGLKQRNVTLRRWGVEGLVKLNKPWEIKVKIFQNI